MVIYVIVRTQHMLRLSNPVGLSTEMLCGKLQQTAVVKAQVGCDCETEVGSNVLNTFVVLYMLPMIPDMAWVQQGHSQDAVGDIFYPDMACMQQGHAQDTVGAIF